MNAKDAKEEQNPDATKFEMGSVKFVPLLVLRSRKN